MAGKGCLSVPGMRGVVPRFARIRYAGFDADGRPIERDAEGFHARVVQHECDHLVGKLYPMRIRDFGRFGFTSVLFPELDPEARRLIAAAARRARRGGVKEGVVWRSGSARGAARALRRRRAGLVAAPRDAEIR